MFFKSCRRIWQILLLYCHPSCGHFFRFGCLYSSFRSTPPGLRHLLARFSCKIGESADQARRRCYRRLFGILWFGNKIGAGQFRGKTFPTYVYPECIKDVVRAIIQENLRDYQDPENAAVYHVTLEDLHRAKWPAMR
ncbi:uncharacterized protein [Montipora capricornis]|uniref:uncharacterized protein n=1 Tax=Montipora capricornis TaxID=246305 RepID=UPI0035F1B06E